MLKERLSPMFVNPRPIFSYYPKSGTVEVKPKSEHKQEGSFDGIYPFLVQAFKEFLEDVKQNIMTSHSGHTIDYEISQAIPAFQQKVTRFYVGPGK